MAIAFDRACRIVAILIIPILLRGEWRDIVLTPAVQQARVQADIEGEGATLTQEGFVIDRKEALAALPTTTRKN